MTTKAPRRNQLLTAIAAVGVAVGLLAARHNVLGERQADETATPVQASIGGVSSDGNPQLEQGKNLLSRQIQARATYLVGVAREQDDARQWLDEHRGNVLGQLSTADQQRGGIWTGEATDNATADLIYETLAVELAMTWLTVGDYAPVESYGLSDYLMAARLAGEIDDYDSPQTILYLRALSLEGLPQEDEDAVN